MPLANWRTLQCNSNNHNKNQQPNPRNDGDFSNTIGVCFTKDSIGTVKLRDLKTQMTSGDFNIVYQGTLIVATYAMGHGVLRSQCAVELTM